MFQISSYGGFLEFTLRFVPRPGMEEPSDGEPLVEISVSANIDPEEPNQDNRTPFRATTSDLSSIVSRLPGQRRVTVSKFCSMKINGRD